MRKRMKKKFAAICISLAITLTGPGMSMVTMTYADEITKENQQDQEISNDQNNTKDGENSNTNDGKETENDLIQGNDSDSSQEKAEENITEEESKEDNMEAQQEEPSEETDSEEAVTQRKVLNINDGWNFSTNDTSTAGWNFPSGAGNGVVNLPHSWEYVHPRQSYIPQMNSKTVTYEYRSDSRILRLQTCSANDGRVTFRGYFPSDDEGAPHESGRKACLRGSPCT